MIRLNKTARLWNDRLASRMAHIKTSRKTTRLITSIFYNNPDGYPPIINSTSLLASAGFKIDIYARVDGYNWGISYPQAVRLHRIDTRGGSSWREYLGFITRALRSADPSTAIFIGHDMHGLLPARLLATRYRRPLVYHCHDFTELSRPLTFGSAVVQRFERRFARTADLVIVPDGDRGRVIEAELRLQRPPLIIANSPLVSHRGTGGALRAVLTAIGYNFEQILFRQGRIGAGHGIEATIRSLPLWNSRRWGFVIMGLGDPVYAEQMTSLASALGVSDQFVILPPVGYNRVPEFTVDATVGHALYDPIHINNIHITTASNKIMEYMAAGLPLLASNSPGLRSFIEHYQCGILADEQVPDSIAAAINELMAAPERQRMMGAAAADAFMKVFCYERQFAPALETILSLISHKAHGSRFVQSPQSPPPTGSGTLRS
jgi:glycosyltransferase involved in cell wall biosynthesis